MRFGGHETFYIREGWLTKGLRMVVNEPERFEDALVADLLGVGRNMAKSIEHWLQATGLAMRVESGRKSQANTIRATPLGEVIWSRDPYFTHASTWWFLHINIVCNPDHAASWNWFFNEYPSTRFERSVLVSALERTEKLRSRKPPSRKTIERDVGCLLGSYAVDVPYRKKDPEEEIDCPFQELRLVRHYRASGYFELNKHKKHVEPEVVLYAMNQATVETGISIGDIRLQELMRVRNGPAQTLCLSSEALYEHITDVESLGREFGLSISGLAGDRQIRYPRRAAEEIAAGYFDRVREHTYA